MTRIDTLLEMFKADDKSKLDENYIISCATDEDPDVRAAVADLLSYFKDDAAKNTLLKLATDEDEIVRADAYESLSYFADSEIIALLINAFDDKSEIVACTVISLFGRKFAKDMKIMYQVCQKLRVKISNCSDRMYAVCIITLQKLTGRYTSELVRLLRSDDYTVRDMGVNYILEYPSSFRNFTQEFEHAIRNEEIDWLRAKMRRCIS